eukprot:m.193656 g.193656  ORF g.193656 m.193656 type:complete len:413 (-) comp18637_c0_seq4:2048-3286(-)
MRLLYFGHLQASSLSRHLFRASSRWSQNARSLASFYDKTVATWSTMDLPPVKIQNLFAPTTEVTDEMMLNSARNVRSIVAVRLARRIHKIQQLPFIVGINPHINLLHDLYFDVFSQLIAYPEPKTTLDERTMTQDLFPVLLQSTVSVMPMLGRASHELRKVMPLAQLTELFNSLLTGRILRRTLMQHHMSLDLLYRRAHADGHVQVDEPVDDGFIGMHCDLEHIANTSFQKARYLCMDKYGFAVDMVVEKPPERTICYFASHLDSVLEEVFKNACVAVMECALRNNGGVLTADTAIPPIEVSFYKSDDEITIKVCDQGGGIPKEAQQNMFNYGYSAWSADGESKPLLSAPKGSSEIPAGLRGLLYEGFGLPMALQYVKFFGGDIKLQTVPGHGTDVNIHLRELHHEGFMIQD